MMKKYIMAAMMIFAVTIILTGCGESTAIVPAPTDSAPTAVLSTESDPTVSAATENCTANRNEKDVDLENVMDLIRSRFGLGDMRTVTDAERYYAIKADDLDEFCAQVSSDNSRNDEIVICKASSDSAVNRIENSLNRRLDALYNTAKSYSKDDLERLESCHVTVSGSYVYLVIAPNASEIEQFIEAQIN